MDLTAQYEWDRKNAKSDPSKSNGRVLAETVINGQAATVLDSRIHPVEWLRFVSFLQKNSVTTNSEVATTAARRVNGNSAT